MVPLTLLVSSAAVFYLISCDKDENLSWKDEQINDFKNRDIHLDGVMKVFSKNNSLPVGLPNLGNTCYLNSIL